VWGEREREREERERERESEREDRESAREKRERARERAQGFDYFITEMKKCESPYDAYVQQMTA
jgi:hypothetical protein